MGADGVIRMGSADKCQIAQELFWHRGRLASPADCHALAAAIACSRRATAFFDIGAYTGLFALAAGRVNPAIRCYAYEIFPENFLTLYDNVIRNNLVASVEPRLCGVADKAGTLRMPVSTALGLLPSSFAIDWKFSEGVDVPLRTLDELHADVAGPAVIKIDEVGS